MAENRQGEVEGKYWNREVIKAVFLIGKMADVR